MTRTKQNVYTYKDYAKLPEGAPYQLIGGELVKSPSPTPLHQEIILAVCRKFLPLQDAGKGKVLFAPLDVYLGETETYQPDLLFIREENLSLIGEKKIEGAPDVVMEVLSPSTGYYDLRHKKEVYGTTGVREYWIVDPMERSVEIYTNTEGELHCKTSAQEKGDVQSIIFPEVSITLTEIFGL